MSPLVIIEMLFTHFKSIIMSDVIFVTLCYPNTLLCQASAVLKLLLYYLNYITCILTIIPGKGIHFTPLGFLWVVSPLNFLGPLKPPELLFGLLNSWNL